MILNNTCPGIIPEPRSFRRLSGEHSLLPITRIITAPEFYDIARYLRSIFSSVTGWEFAIEVDNDASATIADPLLQHAIGLAVDENISNCEGYRLRVGWTSIRLEASRPGGIFYAVQTLLQLLPPAVHGGVVRLDVAWTLPCMVIEDAPRFPWRGAMLDSARYFQPISFIKKFIDLLALHKLNIFHWHLTDDQGWRIEIVKYPRLTEIGAHRQESPRGHLIYNAGGDGVPHGGFYTQDEIREVVVYARERFITIVPEIEMPGHAQAAIAAYPELGCKEEKLEVSTSWGVHGNIFNPEESTIAFLQDVLFEVMDLFPGQFIHIGGDEATKTQWSESVRVRKHMAELCIEDVSKLQSYFITRMAEFLSRHGRRLIGWDEILEGGLPPEATVMSWRGIAGGVAAARAGHDVIMSPTETTYLDSYQSLLTSQEPLAMGAYLSLEKAHRYEPIPSELSEKERAHILGIQGQLWTEYIPTTTQLEYMAFPRLSALAEVAWSPRERRDFNEFKACIPDMLKRLDVLQTNYRPLD